MCLKAVRSLFILAAFTIEAGATAQQKPAWAWTGDDRLTVRLDPSSIRERAAAHFRGHDQARVLGGSTEPAGAPMFVVDGARNPELFMPWELMDQLLHDALAPREQRAGMQHGFSTGINRYGWNETWFWSQLELLGREYDRAATAGRDLQKRADRSSAAQRREALADLDTVNRQLCTARAEALDAARSRFGPQFEQFLYLYVAPTLSLASSTPTNADTLRWIEGGCK